MELGEYCNSKIQIKLSTHFFHNSDANGGISLWNKLDDKIVEVVEEMIWDKTEFNNSNKFIYI